MSLSVAWCPPHHQPPILRAIERAVSYSKERFALLILVTIVAARSRLRGR